MPTRHTGEGSAGLPPSGLPDLPVSPHPNLVTARGLAQLHERLEDARRRLDELEPADQIGHDYLSRHARWLQARIDSAVLVGPRLSEAGRAGFGAWVEVIEGGRRARYRIVGEDEADPAHGLLSWVSPLAGALEGAQAGSQVQWSHAGETHVVDLVGVEYPDEGGTSH